MLRSPGGGSRAANRVQSRGRLEFIDAARGSAMLFVLLSHFAFNYFSKDDAALSMMTLVDRKSVV